ncbi:hypothetical protein ACI2IP_04570 [Microbacterium sp. NPDC090218]
MTAVEMFYDDLDECAKDFTDAATRLQFDVSRISGDDPGVGAPVGRYPLKVELNRRMDQLRDATFVHGEAGAALATGLFAIASKYSELDEELAGEGPL